MSKKTKENKNIVVIAITFIFVLMVIIILSIHFNKSSSLNEKNSKGMTVLHVNGNNNIEIDVTDVTEKAEFYVYDANGIDIEIFAVKASDGTIRTAFNTCQVCSPSPKAYFVQEGKDFICQNCMNAFPTDRIGLERGGCNPIPISFDERKDDGEKIILTKEFVESYKENFDK